MKWKQLVYYVLPIPLVGYGANSLYEYLHLPTHVYARSIPEVELAWALLALTAGASIAGYV